MPAFDKNALLAAVEHIPDLPQLIASLNSIPVDDPAAGQKLDELLSGKQDLAAKALKVYNTIHYAYPDPIASFFEASAIIGYPLTRNVLIVTAFIDSFRAPPRLKFDRNHFWKHCIAVAHAAKEFAEAEKSFSEEEIRDIYLAALFHDFGIVILECFFPEMCQRVLDGVATGESYYDAEKKALGDWQHTVIGRIVAEQWGLPPIVVETAAWHHQPDQVTDPALARCVNLIHLAHYSTELAGFAVFAGTKPAALDPASYASLALTREQIKQLTLRQLDEKDDMNETVTILLAHSGAAALSRNAKARKSAGARKQP